MVNNWPIKLIIPFFFKSTCFPNRNKNHPLFSCAVHVSSPYRRHKYGDTEALLKYYYSPPERPSRIFPPTFVTVSLCFGKQQITKCLCTTLITFNNPRRDNRHLLDHTTSRQCHVLPCIFSPPWPTATKHKLAAAYDHLRNENLIPTNTEHESI